MTRFLIRRVLLGILILFLVSVVVFAATQALPGNAAQAALGRQATPGATEGADRSAAPQRVRVRPVLALAEGHRHRQPRDQRRHPGAGQRGDHRAAVELGVPGRDLGDRRDPAVDRARRLDGGQARQADRPHPLHRHAGAGGAAGVRDRDRAGAAAGDQLRVARAPRRLDHPAGRTRLERPQGGGAAGVDADPGGDAVHQPDHARVDGRGAALRLRDDGAAQGPLQPDRDLAPRGPQRDRPGDPGVGAAARVHGRRRRRRRVRVQLQRRSARSSSPR